jgi:signal transduction histidine kinase
MFHKRKNNPNYRFSALLLWLAVYAIKVINFNKYADGSSLDVGSLIKSLLFLASFSFTLSIFLGIWIHYKTKSFSSDNQSKWIIKLIKWFTLELLVLMMPIPLILFPESDKIFEIFLIVLLFAIKYVRDKMLKKLKLNTKEHAYKKGKSRIRFQNICE